MCGGVQGGPLQRKSRQNQTKAVESAISGSLSAGFSDGKNRIWPSARIVKDGSGRHLPPRKTFSLAKLK